MDAEVKCKQLPDGQWEARAEPPGVAATGSTQQEAMNALKAKLESSGGGRKRIPTEKEELPDGRWRVWWPDTGLEGFGATVTEATQAFVAALQSSAGDPAVATAMQALSGGTPPSRPSPPSLEIPEEYASLPSITGAEFDEVVAADTPVLVDFWASWCRPCLAMAPALADLQKEMGDRLRVVKVDVQVEPELAQRCGIAAIPTLLLYRQGEQLHRIVGAQGITALRAELEPFLG